MTLKINAISDLHLDWSTSGIARFNEGRSALDKAVEDTISRRANVFVFCGDLCNPDSGSSVFRCVAAAVAATLTLARHDIVSIWLTGNHDVIEDGSGESTLEPLVAVSRTWSGSDLIHVANGKVAFNRMLWFRNRPYQFVCLPFVATDRAYDAAEMIRSLPSGGETSLNLPMIVFSHLHLRGIIPGEETQDMPRGRDIWLPDEQLKKISESRPVHVFSGHYHRRQVHTTPSGLEVNIIGAPVRFTHGEESHVPAFLRIDIP